MDSPSYKAMKCPQCGSDMCLENDNTNEVNVFLCTKPTCLYRVYPDYPRREWNQDICYLCGIIFTVPLGDLGMLCPTCKQDVTRCKRKATRKRHGVGRSRETENILCI